MLYKYPQICLYRQHHDLFLFQKQKAPFSFFDNVFVNILGSKDLSSISSPAFLSPQIPPTVFTDFSNVSGLTFSARSIILEIKRCLLSSRAPVVSRSACEETDISSSITTLCKYSVGQSAQSRDG